VSDAHQPDHDAAGETGRPTPSDRLAHRHLVIGWWSLCGFAALGLVLEALHGFKVSWYLDVGEETRRLLLRLAHAHGVLLALVHIAFAATLRAAHDLAGRTWVSACLIGALVAMPGGFLLGGLLPLGGDPGVGIFAVPVGALLLLAALARTALGVSRART
jgi:hypothetical protein